MKKGGNVGSGDPAGRKAIIRASLGLSATMRAQAAKVRAEVRDIVRSRSLDPKVASRARDREGVYSEVAEKYRELARKWGYTFGKAVDRQSEAVAEATAKSMPSGATPKPLTAEQKIVALNGRTVERMVAVATESMAENAVKSLRTAAVRVFARGAVEGLSDHEIQKALQEEWDKEAGDQESHRFRDKNGRSWSNASYLQMLTRTTLANVSRNTQIATLTQNGCDLARISDDGGGDSCDACSRWAGRIVSLTGATKGYPTLDEAEADGLFHPNCVHRIEYLDEDEIPEDAKKHDEEPEDSESDQRDEDVMAAREAISRVAKMEFKTSDGVTIHGGVVKGSDADYGLGYHGGPHNCFANSEAQEARYVYGLDVFPRRAALLLDYKSFATSLRRAISDGEFIPTSQIDPENKEPTISSRVAVLERLRNSPDGTFLRNIKGIHSSGFVKTDNEVLFVDGYYGTKKRVVFSGSAKDGEATASEIAEQIAGVPDIWKKTKEEYSGVVFIRPSVERAKYLAESRFIVGDKSHSSIQAD